MKLFWIIASTLCITLAAHAAGLKTVASKHDFADTQSRLEAALKEKNLTLFAKIDHQEGAEKAGLKMLPETVTIFGNPKGGTPFMVASPEAAIDFPLKALVHADAKGKVYVSYYPLTQIVKRHHIKGQDALAKILDGVLAGIAKAATE